MDLHELNANFDSFFASEGGAYDYLREKLAYDADYTGYLSYIDSIVSYQFRSNARKNLDKKPAVVVGYVNNDSLNAYAAKDKGVYYIGINTGVAYLLQRLFNEVLSNPKNLPNIGDASKETGSQIIREGLYGSVSDLLSSDLPFDYDVPKDEKRAAAASLLTTLALGFLSMHELSHILNGHVGYLNAVSNIRLLQEKQISEEERAEYLMSQTIEFDADALGICRVINDSLRRCDILDDVPASYKYFFESKARITGMTAFAIYSVFRLFGSDFTESEPMMEQYYPPFDVRRRMIGLTISSLLSYKLDKGRFDETTAEGIMNNVKYCLACAEAAFIDSVIDQDTVNDLYRNTLNTKVELDQINIIKTGWITLRPELEKYAYAELVPPDDLKFVYIPFGS